MEKLKHIYFEGALSVGSTLDTPKNMPKRLLRTLHLKKGDHVALFNNKDGLFQVEILNEKCTNLYVKSIIQPQTEPSETTLMVAVIEEADMDKIFGQATEFGITDIIPLTSEHTVIEKFDENRMRALLIEASEQCERLTVPTLHKISHLEETVKAFGGRVYWCAEHVGGKWNNKNSTTKGDAILIGPEGGFSQRERVWLKECINIVPVGLDKHILRSDTASCAALSRFFDHFE